MTNINDLVLEDYNAMGYPSYYQQPEEDEEKPKKSGLGKALGLAGLGLLGGGAAYTGYKIKNPNSFAAIRAAGNGVNSWYHKNRAVSNLKSGNFGDALGHGMNAITSGAKAAWNGIQSPFIRNMAIKKLNPFK